MTKIKLNNRYNSNLWLEHIENKLWTIKSENKDDLYGLRLIFENDNKTIHAIDPSGGPFLNVGTILSTEDKKYKIISITSNLIFELDEIV